MARILEISQKKQAFEAVEEAPEDDVDTYLDEDLSENDDPHIDEDGNFLANEQIVSGSSWRQGSHLPYTSTGLLR